MTILIAFVSSSAGAIIAGIFALITRHLDKKDQPIKSRFDEIDKRMGKAEKDSVRTQILLLISDYPEDHTEILEVARHYFKDLQGDWFMTSIFNKWLAEQNIGSPDWFNPKA